MGHQIHKAGNKKLQEWLEGVPLSEKIKTLEKGRLLMCSKCGFIIFDKEKSNHRRRKCKPSGYEHSFVQSDWYIVLRRNFIGIADVVNYCFCTPEEAVIEYFAEGRFKG